MIHRSWRLLILGTLAALLGLLPGGDAQAEMVQSKVDRLNVRSRPGFTGEVITRLTKGQTVVVLDSVTLRKPGTNEPPVWLRIGLPEGTPVWVAAEYVDADSRRVKADVLNVRAGPSYDHATIARLKRGTSLKPLAAAKDGWLEIASPPEAYGYVPAALVLPAKESSTPATRTTSTNLPAPMAVPVATVTTPAPALAPAAKPATTTPVATTPPPAVTTAVTNATPSAAPAPPISRSTHAPVLAAAPDRPAVQPPASPNPTTVAAASPVAPVVTAPARPAAPPVTRPPGGPPNTAWFSQFVDTNAPPASTSAPAGASESKAPAPVPPVRTAAVEPAVAVVAVPEAAVTAQEADPAIIETPTTKPDPLAGLEDPTARRVRREGIVFRPSNIQAPTGYALKARDRGQTMNFLINSGVETIDWRAYHGKVVIITGREYLDRRLLWRGIPLLNVESIEAVR